MMKVKQSQSTIYAHKILAGHLADIAALTHEEQKQYYALMDFMKLQFEAHGEIGSRVMQGIVSAGIVAISEALDAEKN